jgi:hypothetical protein
MPLLNTIGALSIEESRGNLVDTPYTVKVDTTQIYVPDKTIYVTWNIKVSGQVTIDWGDGTFTTGTGLNNYNNAFPKLYSVDGVYNIKVYTSTGYLWCFVGSTQNSRYRYHSFISGSPPLEYSLIEVVDWGTAKWWTMAGMFSGNFSLVKLPNTSPNLTECVSLSGLFSGCGILNQNINNWDVSKIDNISYIFSRASSFNQPLDNWNVGNVIIASGAFQFASSFNQPINNWNVSNVLNMNAIFNTASSFNQPLNNWNVSKMGKDSNGSLYMYSMFRNAIKFNQDLSNWCVKGVATTPFEFDLNTPVWTLPKPIWGTCPPANLTIVNQNATFTGNNLLIATATSNTGLSPVWSISPQLPTGLSFVNGSIIGTATSNAPAITYTITVTYGSHSDSGIVNLIVRL